MEDEEIVDVNDSEYATSNRNTNRKNIHTSQYAQLANQRQFLPQMNQNEEAQQDDKKEKRKEFLDQLKQRG